MTTSSLLNDAFRPIMYSCFALMFIVAGCSTTSKLGQSAKGSVYLEEVADWSFEASHPAVIDQTTIMKIVKGVYSEDSQNGSSKMSAGGFSEWRIIWPSIVSRPGSLSRRSTICRGKRFVRNSPTRA